MFVTNAGPDICLYCFLTLSSSVHPVLLRVPSIQCPLSMYTPKQDKLSNKNQYQDLLYTVTYFFGNLVVKKHWTNHYFTYNYIYRGLVGNVVAVVLFSLPCCRFTFAYCVPWKKWITTRHQIPPIDIRRSILQHVMRLALLVVPNHEKGRRGSESSTESLDNPTTFYCQMGHCNPVASTSGGKEMAPMGSKVSLSISMQLHIPICGCYSLYKKNCYLLIPNTQRNETNDTTIKPGFLATCVITSKYVLLE